MGAAHPCPSPWAWDAAEKHQPGARRGWPQGWAQPGSAQPGGFSPLTWSQGFSRPGRASRRPRDGLCRGKAALWHAAPPSPPWLQQAGASSGPSAGNRGWALHTNHTPWHPARRPQSPLCPQAPACEDGPSSGDTRRGVTEPRPPRAEPGGSRRELPARPVATPLRSSPLQRPRPRARGTPKTCSFFFLSCLFFPFYFFPFYFFFPFIFSPLFYFRSSKTEILDRSVA